SFSPASLGSGSSTLRVTTSSSTPAGTAALRVTATAGNLSHTTPLTLTVWKDLDVGATGLAGSASLSGSTFTVKGSGSDVWRTAHQSSYVFQPAAADRTFTARVASQQNTNVWAKSGVMIRETTAEGSSYVFVMVTPGNGVDMQARSATGATSVQLVKRTGIAAPTWVRLVRTGNTFTGFTSNDGSSWSQLGTVSVPMAGSASAGLAVCAHDNTVLNSSTFDNVRLQ